MLDPIKARSLGDAVVIHDALFNVTKGFGGSFVGYNVWNTDLGHPPWCYRLRRGCYFKASVRLWGSRLLNLDFFMMETAWPCDALS